MKAGVEGVPIGTAAETIPQLLGAAVAHGPSRAGISFEDQTLTWAELEARVGSWARHFTSMGVGRGDRVAIMSPNHVGTVAAFLGLARIGAVMVPLNPDLGVAEARFILDHAEVSGALGNADTRAVLRDALGRPDAWLGDVEDAAPSGTTDGVTQAALPTPPRPEDTCVIVYTSGTTGFPKGVMHDHRSYARTAATAAWRMRLTPDDAVLVVLPLFHVNALFYSLGGALAAAARVVLAPRFSASRFWSLAAASGATQVNVLESIGAILKARPRGEFDPRHKIRTIYGVRENAAETFRTEFGIPELVNGFGMSEAPAVIANPWEGPRKSGSMGIAGRHPDPALVWAEARVVGDDGQDVPRGETGELWLKGAALMRGYYRDPDQTRAAFRDGWFMTGDLVRQDDDGYFFFVSRRKDIIRRRGENISAAELDRVIGEHPSVAEVATIATPSELGEDEILAAVVVRTGASLAAAEVAAWCGARLAPHKVPRFVAFLPTLPHTSTHKVAKAALRGDESVRRGAIDLLAAATSRAATELS